MRSRPNFYNINYQLLILFSLELSTLKSDNSIGHKSTQLQHSMFFTCIHTYHTQSLELNLDKLKALTYKSQLLLIICIKLTLFGPSETFYLLKEVLSEWYKDSVIIHFTHYNAKTATDRSLHFSLQSYYTFLQEMYSYLYQLLSHHVNTKA